MYQTQHIRLWSHISKWSKWFLIWWWNYILTSWWDQLLIFMLRTFVIVISNHKTSCAIQPLMYWSYVILEVLSSSSKVNLMYLTSALDTIEHQNSFSVIQTTQLQLMSGQLDVLSQSWCLVNQFSLEKVVLTNLLRSLKFLVHHPKNRSKQWTLIIRSIDSHRSNLYHGRKFLDIGHLGNPSIL